MNNVVPKNWEQGELFGSETQRLFVPIVETQITTVRENAATYGAKAIACPEDGFELVAPLLRNKDREHLIAVALNTKGTPNGLYTVSIGGLSQSIIHPREVFKTAIMMCAASLILAHNHPSGDPTPSGKDIEITQKLVEAGELLGIPIFDHLIIGDNRHVSLREARPYMFESKREK